jgi:hypothetical protein
MNFSLYIKINCLEIIEDNRFFFVWAFFAPEIELNFFVFGWVYLEENGFFQEISFALSYRIHQVRL